MEDTCCWHLGCHYCCREPQGGSSPCPALPAVPLSGAPSSSNWVLQRLHWDCPLSGIVAKLTDLFPLACQQSNYGGQTHRLRFCSFCVSVKNRRGPWLTFFVEVAIGEVGDCERIKFTTMLTQNNLFGRIKSPRMRDTESLWAISEPVWTPHKTVWFHTLPCQRRNELSDILRLLCWKKLYGAALLQSLRV